MKKNFTLLLLLIATVSGYSQFSKTHYIPPLTAPTYMSSTTVDVDNYIYISTPSITPVTVTITPLGGKYPVATKTVTNSTPWVYIISAPSIPDPSATPTKPKPNKPAKDGQNTQLFVPAYLLGTVLKDRGYLIEASDFVYANVRVSSKISSGGSSQAGGLVAKGISAYGTEFRIGGMESRGVMDSKQGEALLTFASFVATEDNTTVTITLPTKVPSGTFMFPKTMNGNYPYGYPFPNSDFSYPPSGAPAPTSYTSPTSKNHIYNGPITVTLNKNESYVIAMENSSDATFESNYMIGGLIKSDRNIVVNCGSAAGTSQIKGEVIANSAPFNGGGKDFGFDQIVGADKIGKEFIFVGGSGMAPTTKAYDLERAIIVANVNGTQIFKNGSTTPVTTINAGDYYVFNGNDYLNGNLYVKTSENVFAYQAIAGIGSSGKADSGNQNMYFVPPLNCATPSVVNNIPLINEIGITADSNYDTTVPIGSLGSKNGKVIYPNTIVNIVTQRDVNDPTDPTGVKKIPNDVYINGVKLVPGMTGLTRANVTGKTDIPFVAYSYKTTGGNMSVTASAQVYVSFYGSNDNAAFGSYYSGFDTKPSITAPIGVSNSICIDGVTPLSVTSAVPSDQFQWLYSATPDPLTATLIPDASFPIKATGNNTYIPQSTTAVPPGKGAGYYFVSKISACTTTTSLPIPVSVCPANDDNDPVLNNADMDSDNDGITNTIESYGDQIVDLTTKSGSLSAGGGDYANAYNGADSGTGYTFTGSPTGFNSNLAGGITNSMTYDLNFTTPTSIAIKYNPAGATAAMQSNAAFEVKTSLTSTVTITNPTNQLLIDTNNDGIFESGITQFSAFDVKFKLNPAVLLPATGPAPAIDFKIQTYMATSISFTHQNLNTQPNNTSFSIVAINMPKDSDKDGKPDQVDPDSDEDGIPDAEEGYSVIPASTGDANKNGLDDSFETSPAPTLADTDTDGVPDYLDLDSDNDGISDSVESGKIASAATPPILDADSNGVKNYRQLDSDGDGCFDVVEAGLAVTDIDGKLDTNATPPVDPLTGKVNGGTYIAPANNYYLVKAVAPTKAFIDTPNTDCQFKKAILTVETDNISPTPDPYTYKWEVSTNSGGIWSTVANNVDYSGATTNILTISNISTNGYQYRAQIFKKEGACNILMSNVQTVNLSGSPIAKDITLSKCDVDTDSTMDGVANFDLNAAKSDISTNSASETITYYKTEQGAIDKTSSLLIDPATYGAYRNTTSPNKMDIWARVQNVAGCADIAMVTLNVGVNTANGFVAPTIVPATLCDDASADGKAIFNLASSLTELKKLFPTTGYTVDFYESSTATTAIPTASLYTSTGNGQDIYYRVTNTSTDPILSGCSSVGTYFKLNVEKLPTATNVPATTYVTCGNVTGNFTTTGLEALVLGTGQSLTDVTIDYYQQDGITPLTINGVPVTDTFPATFTTGSTTIKATVTNRKGLNCTAPVQALIPFTVYSKPVLVNNNPVVYVYSVCDTDTSTPAASFDGKAAFNLASLNDGEISTETNLTYTYYSDITGAQNADASKLISSTSYTNINLYTEQVYARVENVAGCFSVAPITLNVIATYPTSYKTAAQPASICDDDHDGIQSFDLTNAKNDIEGNITDPNKATIYTFTYYRDQNLTKVIAANEFGPGAFKNDIADKQDIYVKVTNSLNGTCINSGAYITVIVEKKPYAYPVSDYKQCDDDNNPNKEVGFTNIQNGLEQQLLKTQSLTDVSVSYFAEDGTQLPNPLPNPFITTTQTIKAIVKNKLGSGCSDETLIKFQVDARPVVATASPIILSDCADEVNPVKQEVSFDTTGIQLAILGTQQPDMVVKYTAQNGDKFVDALPNPYISGTQIVNFEVVNPQNTTCPATGTIEFKVNPLPNIDENKKGDDDKVICSNLPALTFTLDAAIKDGSSPSLYTYQWSKDGVDIPAPAGTNYTLTGVNTAGLYAVEVTSAAPASCPAVRTINVTASEIAQFQSVPFTVTDLTQDNTITVNLASGLKGHYEYSLDDEIGFYQDSNVFANVSPGTHLVYVRDKNGCGIESDAVAVIGVPKFFTPNGDGHNDTWNIGGLDPDLKYTIFIYDRYGKLIKELIPQSTQGWDGIFNGSPLPGSDYWYSLKLENGREAKGHFSLKR